MSEKRCLVWAIKNKQVITLNGAKYLKEKCSHLLHTTLKKEKCAYNNPYDGMQIKINLFIFQW